MTYNCIELSFNNHKKFKPKKKIENCYASRQVNNVTLLTLLKIIKIIYCSEKFNNSDADNMQILFD